MSFMDLFRSKNKGSHASLAKERLQIIVAHERIRRNQPDYLPQLHRDIVEVIRRYVPISDDQVQVDLENQGNCSVLELNITLPDR